MAITEATPTQQTDEGDGIDVVQPSIEKDDSIESLLNHSSTTATPSPQEEKRRQEYQARLRSYQPETYFAKPCELSPIIAARFGWRNTEKDILTCDYCKSVVAVIFHPHLSKDASQRLTLWYESQLATSHSVACPCRRLAEGYYNKSSENSLALNSSLASVLPPSEVELIERTQPNKQLISLLQQVAQIPDIEFLQKVPSDIAQYKNATGNNATAGSSLSTRMLDALRQSDEKMFEQLASGVDSSILDSIVITVLFGWRLEESDGSSSRLSCPFCLASFSPPTSNAQDATTTNSSTTDEPSHKRARVEKNPWDTHRHYCPVTCGFVKKGRAVSKPLWQILADKYLSSGEEADDGTNGTDGDMEASSIDTSKEDTQSAWMKVHQMLSLGIARDKK